MCVCLLAVQSAERAKESVRGEKSEQELSEVCVSVEKKKKIQFDQREVIDQHLVSLKIAHHKQPMANSFGRPN